MCQMYLIEEQYRTKSCCYFHIETLHTVLQLKIILLQQLHLLHVLSNNNTYFLVRMKSGMIIFSMNCAWDTVLPF